MTVDACQGSESDITVMSLVRTSKENTSHLSDQNRCNMWWTRAISCNVVVGRLDLVRNLNPWRKLEREPADGWKEVEVVGPAAEANPGPVQGPGGSNTLVPRNVLARDVDDNQEDITQSVAEKEEGELPAQAMEEVVGQGAHGAAIPVLGAIGGAAGGMQLEGAAGYAGG